MTIRPQSVRSALHGRDTETLALDAALNDGLTRAVVISGPPGVGKTAFLHRGLAALARGGALIGYGKHVEAAQSQDLTPLITALEQAVSAGLATLYDPDAGLHTLRSTLAEAGATLGELGFGHATPRAGETSSPPLSPEAVEARVVYAIEIVLSWLEGFGAPIVLALDDWGRANERTRRIYQRLASGGACGVARLMFAATERDTEPYSLAIPEIQRIALGPLADDDAYRVIADLVDGQTAVARAVQDFRGGASNLPLDILETIYALRASGGLKQSAGMWKFDAACAATGLAASFAETLDRRLHRSLPTAVTMAYTLAHFGDAAPLDALGAVCGFDRAQADEAASDLERHGFAAIRNGQLVFAHDRIRAALLDGCSTDTSQRITAVIAETLRARGAEMHDPLGRTMLEARLYAGLTNIDASAWGALFVLGAQLARRTGSQEAANAFAEAGLLLTVRCNAVTAESLREGTHAALARAEHDLAIARALEMRSIAVTALDLAEADELCVLTHRMSGDLDGALAAARVGLARQGVRVREQPNLIDLLWVVARALLTDPRSAAKMPRPSADELAAQTPMMRSINAMGTLLFERDPIVAAVFAASAVTPRLALTTAAGAGGYAYMCAMTGLLRRAAEWARLSDTLQRRGEPLRAVAREFAKAFGHWYVLPRAAARALLGEVDKLAQEEGDLAIAAYVNRDQVIETLFSDAPLAATAAAAERASEIALRHDDPSSRASILAVRQLVANLMTPGVTPWRLEGLYFSEAFNDDLSHTELINVSRGVGQFRALLGVAFGAYAFVSDLYDRERSLYAGAAWQLHTQSWTFYTALALYRVGRKPKRSALAILRRIARFNPTDHRHRVELLAAERARQGEHRKSALSLYASAVESARRSRCAIEHALIAGAASEGARLLEARDDADRYETEARVAWAALGRRTAHQSRQTTAPTDELVALRQELERLKRDATRREHELEAARAHAERANKAKSRWLATIGHELRTPLQGISGLLDLARHEREGVDPDALHGAVDQLVRVVQDLGEMGGLDGGVVSLAYAPFHAARILEEVAAEQAPAARAQGRDIQFVASATPMLFGDAARIRQIVSNLVANAVKHGAGSIRLSMSAQESETVALVISVSDEGPPLTPQAMARLFEPFERGAGAEAREGLGIGLSLGRRLARAMGGDLTARNGLGGPCFELALNLNRTALPQPVRARVAPATRVLLAEDVDLNRDVLARILRADGCEVVEAKDGASAIENAKLGAYDLVVLDARMPEMSGVDVARWIRNQTDWGADVHIVLATASVDDELARTALGVGVSTILQKPVSRERLRNLFPSLRGGAFNGADENVDANLIAKVEPEVRAELAALLRATRRGDHAAVRASAHRLTGLAAHFGLTETTSASRAVEHMDADSCARRVHELRAAVGRIDWRPQGTPSQGEQT